jgi:hypothetical protein
MKAKTSLIKFTDNEPTVLLADSKASEVTVQKTAVSNAANSPVCELMNSTLFLN